MTNASDITTIRLPHTGLRVPDRSLTATGYREIETSDGVAFSAKLRVNRRIVGLIENGGYGGPTGFAPNSPATYNGVHLLRYAGRCRTEDGAELTQVEALLDLLVDEAEWCRKVTAAAKKGRMALRRLETDSAADAPYALCESSSSPPTAGKHWGELSRQLSASANLRPDATQWWQGWNGGIWRDITARPAHVDPDLYN